MNLKPLSAAVSASLVLLAAAGASSAQAADWSDTSIGYRFGTQFAEPYNPKDVTKNIVNLTHVSGYKYGSNFLNVDLLNSGGTDSNAQEAYVVYRHTLDLGKATGKDLSFGPFSGVGLVAGFDWNTKNDTGYASKKRMLVVGPTVFVKMPAGFLNLSLLMLHESNRPKFIADRYTYDNHPMLGATWGIPLGSSGLSFSGYANYIASKGKNETGGATAPEFNIDAQVMYDFSGAVGLPNNTLKGGVGYQYWHNKFGNLSKFVGTEAKSPMVRVEYHF